MTEKSEYRVAPNNRTHHGYYIVHKKTGDIPDWGVGLFEARADALKHLQEKEPKDQQLAHGGTAHHRTDKPHRRAKKH